MNLNATPFSNINFTLMPPFEGIANVSGEAVEILSQETIQEKATKAKTDQSELFIGMVSDEAGSKNIYDGALLASYLLHHKKLENPTTRAPFKKYTIYKLDQSTNTFKQFCDQEHFKRPFYIYQLVMHDSDRSSKEKAEACYQLGNCFLHGIDTASDKKLAAELYEKSAKAGHQGAQMKFHILLASGEGVEKNAEASLAWLEAALKQPVSEPNFFIKAGYEYECGIGRTAPDATQKALRYYKEAAQMKSIFGIVKCIQLGKPDASTEAMLRQELPPAYQTLPLNDILNKLSGQASQKEAGSKS